MTGYMKLGLEGDDGKTDPGSGLIKQQRLCFLSYKPTAELMIRLAGDLLNRTYRDLPFIGNILHGLTL